MKYMKYGHDNVISYVLGNAFLLTEIQAKEIIAYFWNLEVCHELLFCQISPLDIHIMTRLLVI